jgi:putative SOS response-associated peptidase YedK
MCGRITLTISADDFQRTFGYVAPAGYRPRYNIAPGQDVLALAADDEGEPRVRAFRWGLVPFWAKDASIGNRLINARGETVGSKPAFRAAFARRRCLVIVDGFYEWQKAPEGKRPHRIRRPTAEPFTLAGLWERWDRGAAPLESCTIITTRANATLAPIHDRMPVIVPATDRRLWLDPATPAAELERLILPCPPDELEAYEVSTLVNRPANDEEECIHPVKGDPLTLL